MAYSIAQTAELSTFVSEEVKAQLAPVLLSCQKLQADIWRLEQRLDRFAIGFETDGRRQQPQQLRPRAMSMPIDIDEVQVGDLKGYAPLTAGKAEFVNRDTGIERSVCKWRSHSLDSLGPTEDELEEDVTETMFGYCVFQLSSEYNRDRYVWTIFQLVSLAFIECTMSSAYADATSTRSLMNHWKPVTAQVESSCLYQGRGSGFSYPKVLYGQPWVDLIVGVMCFATLGLRLKVNTHRMLHALEAKNLAGIGAKASVYTAYLMQTLSIPFNICWGASMMLVGSSDVSQIILNAFAASFLLELDELFYCSLLDTPQKLEYKRSLKEKKFQRRQSQSQEDSARHSLIANVVCLFDAAIMLFPFFSLRMLDWDAGPSFRNQFIDLYYPLACLGWIGRCMLFEIALGKENAQSPGGCYSCARNVVNIIKWTVVGVTVVMTIQCLSFQLWLASDTVFDYPAVFSCLNGTSTAACSC